MPVKVETAPAPSIPKMMMQPYPEPVANDIFTRQYLASSLAWLPANNAGVLLGSVIVPQALASFDVLQLKLQDYAYTQMDVEVTCKIVCSQYHYGAILVGKSLGRPSAIGATPWSMDWRQFVQGGTILICNDKQSCTFDLNWHIPLTFMPNSSWASQLGTIYLFVFDKLASIDPNAPAQVLVQTWLRLKRIRLAGPDPAVGPPVMGVPLRGKLTRQSKRETISKEAEKKSGRGILTGVAEAVAHVAPMMASVPVVGEIAAAVGATAGVVAPIFKSLGWSKPTDVQMPTKVMPSGNQFLCNNKGADTALRIDEDLEDLISLHETTAPFGTWAPTILEFAKRLGLVDQFQWTASSAVSTKLKTYPVNYFFSADNAPSGAPQTYVVVPTPMAYITQYFGYARGSIKYAILCNGSSFVSGVLRVSYVPGATAPATMESYGGDLISRLVEVKGPTWIFFTVPYLAPFPWIMTQIMATGARQSGPFGPNEPSTTIHISKQNLGNLVISVAEPLVVTSTTVNPVVNISVFQGAGDDFQLKAFTGRQWTNGAQLKLQLGTSPIGSAVERQANMDEISAGEFPGLAALLKLERDEGYVYKALDYGFVQIMHRYSSAGENAGPTTSTPAHLWYHGINNNTVWNTQNNGDFLSELGILFRYWRGSLRYAYWRVNAVTVTVPPRLLVIPLFGNAQDEMSPGVMLIPKDQVNSQNAFAVEIPWRFNGPYQFVYGVPIESPTLFNEPWLLSFNSGTEAYQFARSAGDDFGLSGPMACPTMIWNTSTPSPLEKEKEEGLQLDLARERQNQQLLQKIRSAYGAVDARIRTESQKTTDEQTETSQ